MLTLFLNGGVWEEPGNPTNTFTITTTTQIIFYDFTGQLQCNITCTSNNNHYFNNTLGWIMGFRVPYMNINASGNSGTTVVDLNGTKYLILVIDDYNQNHVNNSFFCKTISIYN